MQHRLPLADLGRHGDGMARAISSCVHCGFCLPACPTYRVLGEEMDSPRGRILLMKQALEGTLPLAEAQPYIDRCLGCLGCETACPSGVRYRELVVPFRAHVDRSVRSPFERLARWLLLATLESPARFRGAARAGAVVRPFSGALPRSLRSMLDLLPESLPPAERLPPIVPAAGPRRARVALLDGCVQRALRPSINTAAVRLLAANGVEVVVPAAQGCCGALARHAGLDAHAERLAEHNRRVFPRDVDAILTTAAGCGSAMQEDADLPAPAHDAVAFLDAIGLRTPLALSRPTTAAYQDACHLAHGQQVRSAPRRLLRQVEQLTLVDLPDDLCCGSAGLYNLEHPAIAATLGRRKADAIRATGAAIVATGNIGCLTQMAAHLASAPSVGVQHTMELLDSAYSARNSDQP
jgi:glycolate oxidase iron-sulfur subunit